jgi:hypothetical protein
MLKSIGQEAEDPESATSLPRRFYEQANEQIMASKAQNGAYTAQDATAALQLVSFSLFVGGVRGWENALQIAGDWYEKTGVVGSDNPLRAMWELNLTAKFASRLTVWFDIFSCELLAFLWFPLFGRFHTSLVPTSPRTSRSQSFWFRDDSRLYYLLSDVIAVGGDSSCLSPIHIFFSFCACTSSKKKFSCTSTFSFLSRLQDSGAIVLLALRSRMSPNSAFL